MDKVKKFVSRRSRARKTQNPTEEVKETSKSKIERKNVKKAEYLQQKDFVTSPEEQVLTTNQGVAINNVSSSLKAGTRGPSLLEDFMLRERITHFDHERIPERIVHARGSGAHGFFELTESLEQFTTAGFLTDTKRKTPTFVRFSTVAGSKGSPDLARDIRGFAVKFYTQEGVFDIVGNNTPVFFIQDAMKFPDLVHSVKPEPDRDIPQAGSAHDTFYDFVSLTTETLHNHIWAMSDRAIPRSLRMMEGFGIHTFRLLNKEGKSHFVRFHFKPKLGVRSVTWDEAVKINGADIDFHRRDLWDAIESGEFPEWDFGVQIIPQEDEHKFDFDLLDPTKLIPEEMVPVKVVGRLVLNRNPDNFFAETEQVAFCPGHLVPGIDFTNDPLLQGRLFSYLDTQISRLGGPNFAEIPINRPKNAVHNNQRDGHMRMTINKGRTHYFPNRLSGGCPYLAKAAAGGFVHFEERIDAAKIRDRSESFKDHFSQPALFYRSLKPWEQRHVANSYSFELGKITVREIQERMVFLINKIDEGLAQIVAGNLGMDVPKKVMLPLNQSIGADDGEEKHEPLEKKVYLEAAPSLSQEHIKCDSIATLKVAILVSDGFNGDDVVAMAKALKKEKAVPVLIATHGGDVICGGSKNHGVDAILDGVISVLFDALYIPGGAKSIADLKQRGKAVQFINETLKHCKAIAVEKEGLELFDQTYGKDFHDDAAVVINKTPADFITALKMYRNWEREPKVGMIPA